MDWSTLGGIVAVGLVVVFVVLILLVLLVYVFGWAVKGNNKPQKAPQNNVNKVVVKNKTAPSFTVQTGISDEVVAAISAALAMMTSEDGKQYRIKSVKRIREARSAWSMAGLLENTRAF